MLSERVFSLHSLWTPSSVEHSNSRTYSSPKVLPVKHSLESPETDSNRATYKKASLSWKWRPIYRKSKRFFFENSRLNPPVRIAQILKRRNHQLKKNRSKLCEHVKNFGKSNKSLLAEALGFPSSRNPEPLSGPEKLLVLQRRRTRGFVWISNFGSKLWIPIVRIRNRTQHRNHV